jgi:hypothetical protein
MSSFVKRREFLGQLIVLSAAGNLTAWGFSPSTPFKTRKNLMLHELTVDDFASHLNTRFELELEPGRRIDLHLAEAVSLGSGGGARPAHLAPRGPFSVVFLAPKDASLPQGIYRLLHPAMGEMEIFLVPIGRDSAGLKCEAIFN